MKHKPERLFLIGSVFLCVSIGMMSVSYPKVEHLFLLAILPFLCIYIIYTGMRNWDKLSIGSTVIIIHFILSFIVLFAGVVVLPYLAWTSAYRLVYFSPSSLVEEPILIKIKREVNALLTLVFSSFVLIQLSWVVLLLWRSKTVKIKRS